jgi:hypothetical protein
MWILIQKALSLSRGKVWFFVHSEDLKWLFSPDMDWAGYFVDRLNSTKEECVQLTQKISFDSRAGHWMSRLRIILVVFLFPSRRILWYNSETGHDRFLPCYSQFVTVSFLFNATQPMQLRKRRQKKLNWTSRKTSSEFHFDDDDSMTCLITNIINQWHKEV